MIGADEGIDAEGEHFAAARKAKADSEEGAVEDFDSEEGADGEDEDGSETEEKGAVETEEGAVEN